MKGMETIFHAVFNMQFYKYFMQYSSVTLFQHSNYNNNDEVRHTANYKDKLTLLKNEIYIYNYI